MADAGKTNGIDQEKLKGFVGKLDDIDKEIASEQGRYMKRCQDLRNSKKQVFKEAKLEGVPTKELKAVMDARDLQNKAIAVRDDLDQDSQHLFDEIAKGLGVFSDTPLGAAALAAAKPRGMPGANAPGTAKH